MNAQKSPSDGSEIWGERRNARMFRHTATGWQYEFRSGETLSAVVADILRERQKTDASVCVDYATISSASKEFLAYNNIEDADLLDGGARLLVPPSLAPRIQSAA